MTRSHGREERVTSRRNTYLSSKHIQQDTEHEKEQIDEELAHDAHHHVLL